jgi:hypothetical protein
LGWWCILLTHNHPYWGRAGSSPCSAAPNSFGDPLWPTTRLVRWRLRAAASAPAPVSAPTCAVGGAGAGCAAAPAFFLPTTRGARVSADQRGKVTIHDKHRKGRGQQKTGEECGEERGNGESKGKNATTTKVAVIGSLARKGECAKGARGTATAQPRPLASRPPTKCTQKTEDTQQ